MDWRLGCPIQSSDGSYRLHKHVGVSPSRVQPWVSSTLFVFISPANKTGHPPPKQAVRSAKNSGREGEK